MIIASMKTVGMSVSPLLSTIYQLYPVALEPLFSTLVHISAGQRRIYC
jgi:hypothetical protein